jgi:glucoside 3-dehydrogenase (cytochrome c) hitch-hiker subunit
VAISESGPHQPREMQPADGPLLTRRAAIQRVSALLGGVALVGGERLAALASDAHAQSAGAVAGVGAFSAADVSLLDDIADTILPETSTPGARAARTGAFMALMVTDAYSTRDQEVFRDGLRLLDEACRRQHGVGFAGASAAARLTLLEGLDREQKTQTDAGMAQRASRAPLSAAAAPPGPPHYFRMMKELALLGYFTSEIGYKQAMRYVESPGRFEPCVPYTAGEKTWAPHA